MKRDLKRYLDLKCDELDMEKSEANYALILKNLTRAGMSDSDVIRGMQNLWADGQKEFLKALLDDLDSSIDKIFNGKNKVTTAKAQLVAYEESLKSWLYNKYHYLKRRNKG